MTKYNCTRVYNFFYIERVHKNESINKIWFTLNKVPWVNITITPNYERSWKKKHKEHVLLNNRVLAWFLRLMTLLFMIIHVFTIQKWWIYIFIFNLKNIIKDKQQNSHEQEKLCEKIGEFFFTWDDKGGSTTSFFLFSWVQK